MKSLRARAATAGILWAVVIIILGFAGLSSYITKQSQARFVELLQTRHMQVVVAVTNSKTRPELIGHAIGDPVYERPFSGQYWQVENSNGAVFVSQSLLDQLLPRPDGPHEGAMRSRFTGPQSESVFGIAQWLVLEDGSRWHVQVASSFDRLDEEQSSLQRNLLSAFAIVVGIGVLGALALVTVVLQPLNVLRKDVATRWEDEDGLDLGLYPIEVAPLVADINTLLKRNREIMRRARRQAADLAHAIKTPSAIMRNELDTLQSTGVDVQDAVDALDRLDAQLTRSFARMRADGTDNAISTRTDLDEALVRMKRAFNALARNADKTFVAEYTSGLRVRMDQSDFEEVIGNLLDNALKWATSQFILLAERLPEPVILITIMDDGPGIPPQEIALATRSGQRLDTSKPGTGLGLAIAADLVHAYGGEMKLGRATELGGLVVYIKLPMMGGRRLPSAST